MTHNQISSPVTIRLALTGILVFVALAGVAHGKTSDEIQLQGLEENLQQDRKQSKDLNRKSLSLTSELNDITARLIRSAKTVQQHEAAVLVLEDQLIVLQFEETQMVKQLARQRVQFSKVLMALERLARYPAEAVIAQPGEPGDIVRSAILLRSVVPELESRAADLRLQIVGLADARDQLKTQRFALASEAALLEGENVRLNDLLVQKKRRKVQTDAERKQIASRVAKLANEANSLRDLMARLGAQQARAQAEADAQAQAEAEAKAAAETESTMPVAPSKPDLGTRETTVASLSANLLSGLPITTRRGKLPYPVVGKLISRYGQANKNGVSERGIKFRTRPSAQVIAPYEGNIAFVGEFRGYGLLLIIEHRGGYHTLLAGMSRIDSVMGQRVLSGEPVGIMGSSSDTRPVLYVELRRDGRPINPLPWLAASG